MEIGVKLAQATLLAFPQSMSLPALSSQDLEYCSTAIGWKQSWECVHAVWQEQRCSGCLSGCMMGSWCLGLWEHPYWEVAPPSWVKSSNWSAACCWMRFVRLAQKIAHSGSHPDSASSLGCLNLSGSRLRRWFLFQRWIQGYHLLSFLSSQNHLIF